MAVIFKKKFDKTVFDLKITDEEANVICNVIIKNDEKETLKKPLFIDNLSKSVYLVPNSFKVNDKIIESPGLDKGVLLEDISPNETVNITFNLSVKCLECSFFENKASLNYEILDDAGDLKSVTISSNKCSAEIFVSM